MRDNVNYLELLRKAQLGDRESVERLAELTAGKVCAYIYRVTLDNVLAQDLSQETILEMIKSLKRLKFEHASQFWDWLFRTALGRIQMYFRRQQHEKTVQMSASDKERLSKLKSSDYSEVLKSLISNELSEAILEAMGKLKFRHRNILVLRCFEQRSYSEIAAIMDCSEMAAQVLFYRAKRSLKRQLSKHGFGKGLLLSALALFAKATAPAEAASAGTVTAASVKVGFAATFIGVAGTKLGVTIGIAIITIALAVGGIATIHNNKTGVPRHPATNISSNNLVSGNKTFEYPCQLLDACDPDGDGWQGKKGREALLIPIVPEKWLVGAPRSNQSAVILPVDHWVELMFCGKIVDGPGDDIFLIEWDANREQAGVFITDGAGNEYWLGMAMAGTSGQPSRTEIGFDISDISLAFVPCAVRIVGIREGGKTPGFDLYSVRARTYVSQDDH
ncbi:MAG: RNA polymerase sigma factor [Planctomycetota bacterium]|jgi:RNA polymerase sigma-70 factor (ECF subfamily)